MQRQTILPHLDICLKQSPRVLVSLSLFVEGREIYGRKLKNANLSKIYPIRSAYESMTNVK